MPLGFAAGYSYRQAETRQEMDWDAITAIAEVTASAGVMVSLVYLGLQIRSQVVESRLESGDELSRQLNGSYHALASETELARIFLKGLEDFSSLEGSEKVRFSAFLSSQMRISESMYFRHLTGRLASEVWTGLNAGLEDLFRSPGTRDWWQTRSHWYSKDFQSHISPFLDIEEGPRLYGNAQ
jgi:hypothetical protein